MAIAEKYIEVIKPSLSPSQKRSSLMVWDGPLLAPSVETPRRGRASATRSVLLFTQEKAPIRIFSPVITQWDTQLSQVLESTAVPEVCKGEGNSEEELPTQVSWVGIEKVPLLLSCWFLSDLLLLVKPGGLFFGSKVLITFLVWNGTKD